MLSGQQTPQPAGLDNQQDDYRLLFDKHPVPMWVLDRESLRFLAVNEAATQQYGYTREEFLAMTPRDLRPSNGPSHFPDPDVQVMEQMLAYQPHAPGSWRHGKKDGSIIDVEITATPVGFEGTDALLVLANDVTDRRRAEEALQNSEDLNRRILKAVPGGIVKVGMDGAVLQANEEAMRMLGLSWDELSRKFIEDFATETIYEDGRPCPVSEYPVSKCLQTGEPQSPVTIGVRRPDGQICWGMFTAVPVFDVETRRLRGAVVTFLDITERKQAEQALRESEERLRRFFEAAFEGLAIHEDGIMLDANQSLADMLGCTIADLIGANVLDFAPPEARAGIQHHISSGIEEPYEAAGLRKDGSTFPSEVCGKSIPYHGRTVRVAALRDITQRKKAEEALRQSEQQQRLISELTSDYAYQCAIEADGNVVMRSATEGFTRVTGYTVEEINRIGGWARLIHPDDLVEAQRRRPAFVNDQPSVQEIRIITKSGAIRWIRYSTVPTWDAVQGRAVSLFGAVQDITESKRAEEKLQDYAQRLRTLSRRLLEVQEQERRHLARELHDEIGQTVTGLRLTVEMCSRLRAGELEKHLQQAAGLLKDLTARIRDLSLRLRPTMLDDLGLVPALLWQLERYTAQTQIQVALEHRGIERRFPAEVETAAYRIVQEALTNVARHAAVPRATVRLWLDQDTLNIQVEDQGRGFDAERAQTLGNSSGLSGMYERAVLLAGRFEVDSRPGAGTRLTAELPVKASAEKSDNKEGALP